MHPKLKSLERIIVFCLIAIMIVIIVLSMVRLGWAVIEETLKPPTLSIESEQLTKIFGFVLMILIALELLESIKAYLREDVIHMEIVLAVALIAIARKLITLDVTKTEPLLLFGIASVVLTLALGYWLIKLAHRPASPRCPKEEEIGRAHV